MAPQVGSCIKDSSLYSAPLRFRVILGEGRALSAEALESDFAADGAAGNGGPAVAAAGLLER